MSELEGLEDIIRRLELLGLEDVVEIGLIPAAVHEYWPALLTTRFVITGERKQHFQCLHPGMQALTRELLQTLLDPDEIHRNKLDQTTAIFWKALGTDGRHYLRAAVRLATEVGRDNPVISAWQVRRSDYQRISRQGRCVWRKT